MLNLEGVKIKNVCHSNTKITITLVTDPSEQICPVCGNFTSKVHDYRKQVIKDLPLQLKPVVLILRKRRYTCSCGKHFYEHYPWLPKYQHMTKRLAMYICHQLRQIVSYSYVASQTNVSSSTVSRVFDRLRYEKPNIPSVLSIDEFKGNAETGKYQCILVDGKKHRILDILPDRTQSHLSSYFRDIPRPQRNRVEFFILDMWEQYRDLAKAYFPNATLIVDKYHFVRQVTWAIENVRKRLQKTMPVSLRKYYKRSRSLILSRYHKLKGEKKKETDIMLHYNDDLRKSHLLKEWFYQICEETRYSVTRTEFWNWIKNAECSGIKEFEDCAKTYRNWSREILNAFKYGYTNGPTEGFNNKIKVLKRVSYGVKNFERFRNRILHTSS
nr:ISL3 family transposase [Mobilitalea sibirica]